MAWYAVDAIDDAIDASREFLFPFSLGRWARLALITLFVGGGGAGVNQVSNLQNVGQFPTGPGGPSIPTDPAPTTPDLAGGVALAIVGAILFLLVALWFISATFEFVFVDVIARDEVRVIDPFGRHAGNGLRLFGFNLALFVVTVAPLAVAGYLAFFAGGPPGFDGFGALGTAGIVVLAGVALVWFLLAGLVGGLTRTLVVPVMVATGAGIVGGWKRLWPRLRTEWKQTLLYLLMHFFVGIGVGLVALLLLLFGAVVVGIVALVVGLAAAALTHGGNVALGGGVGVLAGLVVFLPLFFLLVVLPVGVLTTTYVRTYELAALAGFDRAFDLLGPYRSGMDDGPGGGDGTGTGTDPGDGGPGGAGGGDDADDADDGFGGFVPADEERRGDSGGPPGAVEPHAGSGPAPR